MMISEVLLCSCYTVIRLASAALLQLHTTYVVCCSSSVVETWYMSRKIE